MKKTFEEWMLLALAVVSGVMALFVSSEITVAVYQVSCSVFLAGHLIAAALRKGDAQ